MSALDLKVTALPDEQSMLSRLTSVFDDPHVQEYLYPSLLMSAGKELNGWGVVMVVQLAISDSVRTLPPPMHVAVQQLLRPMVEALIDDETVKADALHLIDEAETARRQLLDSLPPAPVRPELSENDKQSLMRHIKHLAEVYDENVNDEQNVSQAYRVGGVNPFYNQTLNGLYLEFYYGKPRMVWTPWGRWHFAAAQLHQVDLEGFMSRLTVCELIAAHHEPFGSVGPLYAILAIDGDELPEPVLPTDKRQYLDYETAKAEWKQLFGTS